MLELAIIWTLCGALVALIAQHRLNRNSYSACRSINAYLALMAGLLFPLTLAVWALMYAGKLIDQLLKGTHG